MASGTNQFLRFGGVLLGLLAIGALLALFVSIPASALREARIASIRLKSDVYTGADWLPPEFCEPVENSNWCLLKGEALEQVTRALQRPARSRFASSLPRGLEDGRRYVLRVDWSSGQFVALAAFTSTGIRSFFGDRGWERDGRRWYWPFHFRYENAELGRVLEGLRLRSYP